MEAALPEVQPVALPVALPEAGQVVVPEVALEAVPVAVWVVEQAEESTHQILEQEEVCTVCQQVAGTDSVLH